MKIGILKVGDCSMTVGVGLVLLFGALGAAIGWRTQSRRMRWHSLLDGTPGGMEKEVFERRRGRVARIRRLVVTVLYATVGIATGTLVAAFRE